MQNSQNRKYSEIQLKSIFRVYQQKKASSYSSGILLPEINPKESEDYLEASHYFDSLLNDENPFNVYFEEILVNEKNEIIHSTYLQITYGN